MSRNVFLDLGFAKGEAVELALRAQLGFLIEDLIKSRALTQVKAALVFGVPRATIKKIVNKRPGNFSLAYLLRMLVRAGVPFSLEAERDPDNVFVTIDDDESETLTLYHEMDSGFPSPATARVVSSNVRSLTSMAEFHAEPSRS
ncbi:MAG: hypothetical protein GHCLOJNM_04597 [bacterium]|nr:hypothetical protein [bacterium]